MQGNEADEATRALEERFSESCFIPYDWEPIHSGNCLRYFAVSQFYDKRSNNEELERQHKPIECLVQLRGLEFALLPPPQAPPAAAPLFVIAKQIRHDEHQATRRALFYFNNQMILQSPNVREVCVKRLRNASEHLAHVAAAQSALHSSASVPKRTAAHGGGSSSNSRRRDRLRKARADFKLVEASLVGTLQRLNNSNSNTTTL